jgi:hypothetical protein
MENMEENSEKIWKIWEKIDISYVVSNVVFQTLRFEKVRGKVR